MVVCAGRGTAALARGAGLPLPLRQAAHVRLTFAVRGDPPARLACLLDSSSVFGDVGAYADPLPGNADVCRRPRPTPRVHEDGSLIDAGGLAAIAERTTEYVERALPGLDPRAGRRPPLLGDRAAVARGRLRRRGSSAAC